ncbi:TPA: replication initiation protein [Vibrio parahaemolyticus]
MSKPRTKPRSVTKPHDIITARFKLSAREQDLVTLAFMEVKRFADRSKVELGQFDPDKPETLNNIPTIFSYDAAEVAELMGVSLKALNAKDKETGQPLLQGVCSKLIGRRMESSDEETWLVASLISEAKFQNNTLTLEVTRSQAARMLNYGLESNNFGIIDAKLLLGFKSAYTKRILELISRFKNTREFSQTLGELCKMLGTSLDEHSDFARFRRTVLERPLAQIIKESNGVWTAKKGFPKGYVVDTGRGRKVTESTKVTFKMFYNPTAAEVNKPHKEKDGFVSDFETLKAFANGVEGVTVTPELISRVVTGISTGKAEGVDIDDVMFFVKVASERCARENK